MKKKRIYIYGLFTRIFSIFSVLFMMHLAVYDLRTEGVNFDNLTAIIFLSILLLLIIYLQWTCGLFLNIKKDQLIISFELSKSQNIERVLSNIENISLDVIKGYGFEFILKRKYGYTEKILYRFYKPFAFETIEGKRIKRKLKKVNKILDDMKKSDPR